MGGGEHHHEHFKIPDWRMYKVENCPELMQVQQSLNRVGLKDPWLRYENKIEDLAKNNFIYLLEMRYGALTRQLTSSAKGRK